MLANQVSMRVKRDAIRLPALCGASGELCAHGGCIERSGQHKQKVRLTYRIRHTSNETWLSEHLEGDASLLMGLLHNRVEELRRCTRHKRSR